MEKSISVGSSERTHAKPPAKLVACVVKNTRQQLYLLAVIAAEKRIINYQHRLPAAYCRAVNLRDEPACDHI